MKKQRKRKRAKLDPRRLRGKRQRMNEVIHMLIREAEELNEQVVNADTIEANNTLIHRS